MGFNGLNKIKLIAECLLILMRLFKYLMQSFGNIIFICTWEPIIYVSPVYY